MLSKKCSTKHSNLSIVFKISPREAHSFIHKINVLGAWVLRDSSKKGCLTITYLKYNTHEVNHIRFGFLDGRWQSLNDENYDKFKHRIDMTTINNQESVRQLIDYLKAIGPILNGIVGFDINSPQFFRPRHQIECAPSYSQYDDTYFDKVEISKPSGTQYTLFSSSGEDAPEELLPPSDEDHSSKEIALEVRCTFEL